MAKGNSRKFRNLRYPMARLEENSDYLEIKVLEYQPPGFKSTSNQSMRLNTSSESIKNKEEILGKIFLPIPETITDSNGVTWGSNDLNGMLAAVVGTTMDVMKSNSVEDLKAAGSKGIDKIKDLVSDKTSTAAINAQFASSVVNALNGNLEADDILSRSSGQVLNPNMELLFGGVQLRSFSFEFDFAPRDEKESLEIKNIIRALKKTMNAKNGSLDANSSGLFIKSPDVYQLTYKTGKKNHQFLHKFKPMALLNMAVNYTGAGTYATYDNTSPISLKMSLDFQELNPIYSEDYNAEDGLEGTGF
tara:strand:+ start:213 stop:1124 length:912 start_codon:yes stop_codon:yes gene_type:complete